MIVGVFASLTLSFLLLGGQKLSADEIAETAATNVAAPEGVANNLITSFIALEQNFGRTDVKTIPVDLQAQISYWDRRDEAVFAQDEHGAVYLDVSNADFDRHPLVEPGTQVRIVGQLVLDGHYIRVERLDFLGSIDPIEPKSLRIEELSLGDWWSFRVVTSGTIVETSRSGAHWIALVRSGDTLFVVHRFDSEAVYDQSDWIGRQVVVEGTLICELDYNSQPFRYVVRANESDPPLRIVNDRPSALGRLINEAPLVAIDQLHSLPITSGSYYRIAGQITIATEHEGYLLENSDGGAFIRSAVAREDQLGKLVAMTIRRDDANEFHCVTLLEKSFESVPVPTQIDVATAAERQFPFRAVLEGNFVSSISQGSKRLITLEQGKTSFIAMMVADQDAWQRAGMDTARRVSVSGLVVDVPTDVVDRVEGQSLAFAVDLEGIEAMTVVSRWWQFSPSFGISALAIFSAICTAGMICFATLWFRLQRTVVTNRRLEMQLLESQKMDSLGRLAGGVAHDFNNLLAGISSNLELIDRQPTSFNDLNRQCLVAARRCTAQATKLVRSLLGFSRQTNLELERGNINDVIEDAVLLAQTSFTSDVRLAVHLNPQVPICRFDHAQLEQVILNLLFNARDAVANRTLSIDRVAAIEVTSDSSLSDGGKWVTVVKVRDNGVGMDPETTSRVFEPFFTTKRIGEGTGLGLALSYGIIHQHGGSIECESEVGVGTLFTITLPANDQPNLPEAVPTITLDCADYSEPVDSDSLSVLLVDDDDEVRRVTRLSLEAIGHQVIDVSRGDEAIRQVQNGLRPDAVILDMMMPGMSGTETFCQLKTIRPDLPIIICSGLLIKLDNLKQISGREPDGILSKPFQIVDLRQCLDQVRPRRLIIDSAQAAHRPRSTPHQTTS